MAFRGSMELRDWLEADVAIARRMLPTAQLGDAFSFFSSARAQLEREGCKRLLVVGHSLGGGLAAVVAARVTCFPVTGVTFNAPGLASLSRNYGEVEAMDTVAHAIGLVSGLAGRSRLAGRVVEQGFRAAVPIPEARSSLAIAKDNARNVYNVRSVLDPVSLQGQHIGEVFHIPDAGAHPMGPLLEALETDRIGRMVAIMQV
jgi:alpha-beta hydrolase superfamily lysophospholipase